MTTDTNKEQPSPEKEIHSDLWSTMSVTELHKQQELVITKLSLVRSMMPYGVAPQSILGLSAALEMALKDLTSLIDSKASKRYTKENNGKG